MAIAYLQLAAVAAPLFVVSYICKILFDYFRDPKGLRRYPGVNAWAPFTNIGHMWEADSGVRSERLLEMHKTHPVIRTGPSSLSYGEAKAVKDVYGFQSKCIKDDFYEALSANPHYHLADVIDKGEHARKRKVLSSAYALKNLEPWEFKVADKTERLIKAADAACTAPPPEKDSEAKIVDPRDLLFDWRSYSNFFTMDAIADIGLSERLGFLDQGHSITTAEREDGSIFKADYRECLHATQLVQSRLVWPTKFYKTLENVTKVLPSSVQRLWNKNDGWNGIVRHRVSQRLARQNSPENEKEPLDDFVTALFQDRAGKPHNLPTKEIEQEISIMLNAGSDTTAIALTNALYWLLKNPSKLATLRAELETVLDASDTIAPYEKIKRLPYLKACLDESLRLTPPTAFGLPRKTPPEGQYILDEFVPGGTTVSVSAWVAHRDETVFPDPETFLPERWLEEHNPEAKSLQSAFISFSAGPRGCIGKNISYLEQSVLIASFVRRYEMLLPGKDWEIERWENMNLMPGVMPLKLWRRDGTVPEKSEAKMPGLMGFKGLRLAPVVEGKV